MERLQRFLFSRRSLVGAGLAGVGLVLYLTGLLAPTGPFWLTIVVALYFLGVIMTPRERGPKVRIDPAADRESIRQGLNDLVRQIQFKVAADILARVESIRNVIVDTLDGPSARDANDPTVYLIRQTALDYLPSALSAYLALPRIDAERRPVVNGRTPHDVLLEQLVLMDTKMHEAADAILAHDSEKLTANGRFLADRFGTSSLQLGRPGLAPADAPVASQAAAEVPAAVAEPAAAEVAAEVPAPTAAEAPAAEREQVR